MGTLRRQGYELIHDLDEADVILFNTCSVREHAEDKIYSALGRLRGHKRRHPDKVIGVLGCMAQKDQELIRQRAPYVDIVCGPGQLGRLPELIREVQNTGTPQLAVSLGPHRWPQSRWNAASKATIRCAIRRCGRRRSRPTSAS